jgi:PAS domain S-box-containing protein
MPEEFHPEEIKWQKSEERFQLLVQSVKDYGIFTLDTGGYVTSWNEGARVIKGYEEHEIIGSHFSRFYPLEDITNGKPQRELAQAVQEGRVEDEGWRLRKDGTRFWADVVITALRDPQTGVLRGFGKVTRDLSERREAEERLRQSEEQFRLLVEVVEEYAIFMLDATGHVITWNSGAEKAKGYTVEEIVGEHIERFYTPEDRAKGKPAWMLREAERLGHVRDQGMRVRKDGSTFHADVVITAVRDRQGRLRGFSKVTRDITDHLRSREIEAARLVAEKASQAKDEFLAVLSHELRTPLTPVVAGAQYLIDNASTVGPAELLEQLRAIHRNALLEAQLIDDLLDLTRISRGKIELHVEAVDLHAALGDIGVILREEIKAKDLQFSTKLEARAHWTWADPTRIRQAFWNLINNAIKFTPKGGSVSVRSRNDPSGNLVVDVTDTGVGIEPDQMARIFNAFEQGERSVTRKFGGLGLGLAITRSLVEMHGCTISVDSAGTGRGATFQVTLPSIPPPSAGAEAAPSQATPVARSLRILLVEDHADSRRILVRMLSKRGHRLQVAEGVADAIAILAAEQFDVLISDIGLPDGSGLEVMNAARFRLPHLRGIALSGFGMEDDVMNSRQAGFEVHLTKPVDITTLDGILSKMARELE